MRAQHVLSYHLIYNYHGSMDIQDVFRHKYIIIHYIISKWSQFRRTKYKNKSILSNPIPRALRRTLQKCLQRLWSKACFFLNNFKFGHMSISTNALHRSNFWIALYFFFATVSHKYHGSSGFCNRYDNGSIKDAKK